MVMVHTDMIYYKVNIINIHSVECHASNFILLIVPRRYFCGGSYCLMSLC